jgi:soluble lytic murein transglycosylase-like protein
MTVLSPDDVHRYRQIFADEDAGNFSDAQALVAQLDDKSLVGYAEAEHYLSPYSSKTPVSELVEWLNANRDLPVADRIYALAIKRASVPIKRHHKVVGMRVTVEVPTPAAPPRPRGGGYEDAEISDPPLSTDIARQAMAQIMPLVKADQPAQADAILQTTVTQNIPGADVARLSQKVAASYLAEGQDYNAFDVTARVDGVDRMTAPLLDWIAGLAAYRMGKFDVAGQHFEVLAQNGAVPSWTRSQAAFWAARAYMHNGDSLKVITLLVAATRQEPTFYGLLAEKVLGFDTESGFADPVIDSGDFSVIVANPCAHRAVALYQIGQTAPLHEEMQRTMATLDVHQAPTFAAMARQMSQPDLELRASELAAGQGKKLTGLFPVPSYGPPSGYRIDPSLILAFARIESHFQPNATSPAGAHGLMQIMPGTAAHIRGGSVDMSDLNDPSTSLDLGQRYLSELLDDMSGNLIEVAAGYNSGPGNVYRWRDRAGMDKDDPLLFIESMPSPETRNYVKRVLTYYWMYNRRQNERQPTLDQSAQGAWPKYQRPLSAPVQAPPQQQPAAVNTVVSDASYR